MTKARDLSQIPNATLAFRNRIINGDCRIDQRNAGASVTASGTYPVDRFVTYKDTAGGTLTGQRSTIVPAGFVNSLSYTITSAFTPSSSEGNSFVQSIEGFNTADLGWGTANAQPITVSFWVRSSVIGTYGGSVRNDAGNRSYPFSYTITAANTWEYKTITIQGDTTGTWEKGSARGIMLFFSLGTGSTLTGTAGAWAGANYINATGSTNITSTSGATFYITGVQLEKGSTATSFDLRPYEQELRMCQRYCYIAGAISGGYTMTVGVGVSPTGSSIWRCSIALPVPLRTTPSLTETNMEVWNPTVGSTAVNVPGTIYYLDRGIYLEFDLTTTSNHSIPHGYPAFLQTKGSGGKSTMEINAEL